MNIIVKKITDNSTLNEAYNIRREVFVVEQRVDEREEYEHEEISVHFIARIDNEYAGTARWRITENGVKLERFAVLNKFRSAGVGSALLKAVIEDIPAEHKYLYLHAQLTAMGLYSKFGFTETGPMFEEAGIQHYKMVLNR
jgi:predicted GNAT family N-acyltransferase